LDVVVDVTKVQGGWFIAMGAREFRSGPVSEIDQVDWDNLLELRAFTKDREIKWINGHERDSRGIQRSYTTRPEKYFLDIDLDKTKKYREKGCINPDEVFAIGGGKYRLPKGMTKTMEVEIYYREDDKGFYQPFDFRIIGKEAN
jgi:hypothetical protein